MKSLSCALAKLHFSGPVAVGSWTSGGDILAIHVFVFVLGSRYLELRCLRCSLVSRSSLVFVGWVLSFLVAVAHSGSETNGNGFSRECFCGSVSNTKGWRWAKRKG